MNAHMLVLVLVFVEETLSRAALLVWCVAALACSKPVIFEGTTAIAVIGELPPGAGTGIEVHADEIVVRENIEVGERASVLEGSRPVIDALVAISKRHPEIKKIAFTEVRLSEAEARAVAAYLVGRGAPEDITVVGQPDSSGVTRDARPAPRPEASEGAQ